MHANLFEGNMKRIAAVQALAAETDAERLQRMTEQAYQYQQMQAQMNQVLAQQSSCAQAQLAHDQRVMNDRIGNLQQSIPASDYAQLQSQLGDWYSRAMGQAAPVQLAGYAGGTSGPDTYPTTIADWYTKVQAAAAAPGPGSTRGYQWLPDGTLGNVARASGDPVLDKKPDIEGTFAFGKAILEARGAKKSG